jgi:hypothetical protein
MSNNKTLDLRKNKYTIDTLKENIYAVGLLEILRTQTIDEEFAVNYILNEDFQLDDEEEKITIKYVMKMQPHLNRDKLLKLYVLGPSDCDFPNFEKYALENDRQ